MDFNFPYTLFDMRKEIKLNTIVWGLLVALICLSSLFAENGIKHSFILISMLSVVKFLSVTFQFVEVKHAHIVWKLVSLLFVATYLIGILTLY